MTKSNNDAEHDRLLIALKTLVCEWRHAAQAEMNDRMRGTTKVDDIHVCKAALYDAFADRLESAIAAAPATGAEGAATRGEETK